MRELELDRLRPIMGMMLHINVGGLLMVAGLSKFATAEALGELTGYGFTMGQVRMIGVGELITGLLLVIPRTHALGLLLTSSLWGGAICIHMANQEPYVVQAVILLMTWAGGYLRAPRMLGGIAGMRAGADKAASPGRSATRPSSRNGSHEVEVEVVAVV